MNRKLFSTKTAGIITTFLILLTAAGFAEEEMMDVSGLFTYVLKADGATITGYTEEPEDVLVIPAELDGYPVTGIGDSAFADGYFTGVTIPQSVTSIEGEAFARSSLTCVIIPDGVTSIGEWAFKECYDLTDVTIESGVASIGGFAFFDCASLTNVTLPASVTNIVESAFAECDELTLTVIEGSYAEQYAQENGIPFTFAGLPDSPDKTEEETVSFGDLQDIPLDIEELDLEGYELGDDGIQPIARLKALRKLYLFYNCITDLTPLSGLTNLEELNLLSNDVTDISALSGMSRLETLVLAENYGLTDLRPLYELPALCELYLGGLYAAVEDLSVLSPLTQLQVLALSECSLTDLDALAGLTALEVLNLSDNEELADTTPLGTLTVLRELYLGSTAVVDVSPLAGLTGLKVLDLAACGFSDPSPLYSLTALELLDIRYNNSLTRESVLALCEKLPNTEILHDYTGVASS